MTLADKQPVTRAMVMTQGILGAVSFVFFVKPYLRRVQGLEQLDRAQKYLFVSNHVSLLDTILLGGLFWRRGQYPILVLGDKSVWHDSGIKRALSSKIGFLMERGKLNLDRIRELETFGRSVDDFQLLVYPEGTRGDGVNVARCQPGIYHIAQRAQVPIVPIFIANMQRVSTKLGRFHPLGGLRQIEVCFGAPIAPSDYLAVERDAFTEFVQAKIAALRPRP
jgi:1-acyl-sn-glycerol-3-phosphate acyltransferase